MGESGFEKVEGTERELPAQLVLLAMGFLGPQQDLLDQLGVDRDARTNAARDDAFMTNVPGVFVAGEMLDWDAPTGGYLLTACLATGRWAGRAATSSG